MSSKKPTHPAWRVAKITAGICLLILGVAGLFLPILQGVLFLFLALALLATESRLARSVLESLKRRHPGPWRQAEKSKAWISRKLNWQSDDTVEEEASGDEGSSRETT